MSNCSTNRVRVKSNGTTVEVLPDGTTRPYVSDQKTDWARVDAMTDEEAEANALSDPDCQPLGTESQAKTRKGPHVRGLRRALHLTQEEFAERYQIPVGTIRDWEQRRTQPDAAARAYLRAIAGDPEGVAKALAAGPKRSEAAAE